MYIKLIPLDIYLINYFKLWYNLLYPTKKNNFKNLLISFIHLLHLFIISIFIFGMFLPPKFLLYYVCLWLIMISLWYIFNNCPLNQLTYKLGSREYNFINISKITRNIIIFFSISISLFGYKFPDYSLFRLTLNFLQTLSKKFDKN